MIATHRHLRLPSSGREHRAFTMVELVTSLVIVATLMGAMVSLMALAGKANPAADASATALITLHRANDRMGDDLPFATSILALSSRVVTVAVADRDSDAAAETLQYGWSGAAGAPLTLVANGKAPVTIIPSCQDVVFSIEALQETRTVQTGSTTGPVITIAKFDVPAADQEKVSMVGGIQLGQCFHPTVAHDAISYSITSASIKGEQSALALGVLTLDIRTALADGRPSGTVLGSQNLSSNLLGSSAPAVCTVNYSGLTGLDPRTRLALVVRIQGVPLLEIAKLYRASANVVDATSAHSVYSAGWSTLPAKGLHYEIKGQVTTPVYGPQTYRRLYAIRAKVKVDGVSREFVFQTPSRAAVPDGMSATIVGTLDG